MFKILFSLPVRIPCLVLAFILLCFLHAKNWGTEDLLGANQPVTQLDTATAAAASVKLPAAVQGLIDKSDADILKLRQALAEKLIKAQADATRKGDLTLALAIKARVEALDLPVVAKTSAPVKFLGRYDYAFTNGHKGVLDVGKVDVNTDGYHGDLAKTDTGWTITWSNRSQWQITVEDGVLRASGTDGESKLLLSK